MKSGFRIFDTDTHVRPSLETLEPFYDASLRARLPELEPYKRENRRDVEGMIVGRHSYMLGERVAYSRLLGKAAPEPGHFRPRRARSAWLATGTIRARSMRTGCGGWISAPT